MRKKFKLSYMQIIALSFLCIIALGAFLLCLPISSRTMSWTPFSDCLFTATSSTCITGLVVTDTWTHWSLFGQIVIISMIQLGGLGFMTIFTIASFLFKRQIHLRERKLLMISSGSFELQGVVKLIKKVLFGTLIFELVGAALLSIRFIPKMGLLRGIYNAVFHSISAFCNAGFDLMGKYEQFSSLTLFRDDYIVNITIMALILIGGLGFIVWNDLYEHKFRFKKYELHTKIVLIISAVLVVGGTIVFYLLESNGSLSGMAEGEKWLASAFMAVGPRTAGMSTVPASEMSEGGVFLTKLFMFIGGNPCSTAGGAKTTTVFIFLVSAISSARRNNQVIIAKKRIDNENIRQASAILAIYLLFTLVSVVLICAVEPFTANEVSYEVISAIATVGLSFGITPSLTLFSKIILMLLMFLGRVGAMSLIIMLTEGKKNVPSNRPVDKILVG